MNNPDSEKLRGVLELLVSSGNRINQAKPQKYWYPLSQATYGVDEILEAVDSLCSFRTTMWEKTRAFEEAFAAYNGSKHAIMVNSGSTADLLMCMALTSPQNSPLLPGDEVLIPAVTWPTQIWSAMMAGLSVRLVDVDPATMNSTVDLFEAAITPKTRVISLVHLMGVPADVTGIKALCERKGLILLEDCCEAMGASVNGKKVGTFGKMGSFSFFFSHHITTMEGGMIVTDDDHLADMLRVLRAHGWVRNLAKAPDLHNYTVDPRYAFVNWGFNVRPTELQAAFGLHQLEKADAWQDRRNHLASAFETDIKDFEKLTFIERRFGDTRPSMFALPVMVSSKWTRIALMSHLENWGVETRPIVAGNIAQHPVGPMFPCFSEFMDRYPNSGADELHHRGFYMGLSPMNTFDDLHKLVQTITDFFGKNK